MNLTLEQMKLDISNEFGDKSEHILLLNKILEENKRLKFCFHWALGYTDFKERGPKDGAYWWRTELRERSGIDIKELDELLDNSKEFEQKNGIEQQMCFEQPTLDQARANETLSITIHQKHRFLGFVVLNGVARAFFMVDKSTAPLNYKIKFYNMESVVQDPQNIISFLGLIHYPEKQIILRAFHVK